MKHTCKAFLCVLLSAAMLLGLCACAAQSAGNSAAQLRYSSFESLAKETGYEIRHERVSRSDMGTARPDLADIGAEMDAIALELEESTDIVQAFDCVMRAQRLLDEFDTYYVLSEFRYDWDQSDEDALAELQFCEDNYGDSQEWWNAVYWAIDDGPFREVLLPIWNPWENEDYQISFNSFRSDRLAETIATLCTEAGELLSYATVPWNGEHITLDEAFAAYDDWQEPTSAWLSVYGPELLTLYTQVVDARATLARDSYRKESFAHYMFTEYGWEYTPEMAGDLIDDIVLHLLPLDDDLTAAGYWDELYDDYVDQEEFIALARPVLAEMDTEMAEAFDLLLECDLWESDWTDYTYARPYANYLPLYHTAIMLCPYYGDVMSALDFSHEFGHFYEYYVSMDDYSRAMDLSEVHSQAMTLLFAETYRAYHGEDFLRELSLVDLVDTLVYQSFNASIELEAYTLPEQNITEASILRIGRDASQRFGYTDRTPELRDYYWLVDEELFTAPFAPFSYVSSAAAAFELWKLAQEDMDAALEKYDLIVHHLRSESLLQNLRWAQLDSPFERNWAREAAKLIEDQLDLVPEAA